MRHTKLLAILAFAFLAIAASCSNDVDPTSLTDGGLELSAKGGNNGGGGGSNDPVTIDMTGGYEATSQAGQIIVDNRKRTELGGPGDCGVFGCMDFAISLAGSVGACTPDPADLDLATQQELLDQLGDPVQNRAFVGLIDKTGAPGTEIRAVYIDDVSGQTYRMSLAQTSAVQAPPDHYEMTGGYVWVLKDGFGQSLTCPFLGQLDLTVTR